MYFNQSSSTTEMEKKNLTSTYLYLLLYFWLLNHLKIFELQNK